MTTDRIAVRIARDDELGAIAALRWHWVHDHHPELHLPPLGDYVAAAEEWARAHHDTHIPMVAVADGEVVGMAWLAVQARVPSPTGLDRLSGDLQSCYVRPECRGQGVGRRLAEAVLAEARARGLEHVTVHASPRSVPVYQRAGFGHNSELLWRAVGD